MKSYCFCKMLINTDGSYNQECYEYCALYLPPHYQLVLVLLLKCCKWRCTDDWLSLISRYTVDISVFIRIGKSRVVAC